MGRTYVEKFEEGPGGWFGWLAYFGALGAAFMLIEVSVLQRFVLLLGHPVYSLTVTLFSLLLGSGVGAAWSRRVKDEALARSTDGVEAVALAAARLHLELLLIPPFPDGNGRVARLASSYVLMRGGYRSTLLTAPCAYA